MKVSLTKKLLLLLLVSCSLATANAQIQFGLKVGANFATVTGSDATGAKSTIGFNGGVMGKIPLTDMLSLQPEIVYSGQGAKADDGSGGTATVHLNYINVPVLLTYTLSEGVFFQLGPQVGFLMSAKASEGGNSVDIKSAYKSTDFGLAVGAGYLASGNIGINARYNLGLANIGNGNPGSLKNSVIQVGLFYLLGDSGKK